MISFGLKTVTVALVAFLCATTTTQAQEQQQQHERELRVMIDANFQAAMLQAVNAERAKQGLAAFCTNGKLQKAAQLHSEDQAKNNMMSHTGSDGSQMSQRISAQGFSWTGVAENVAAGQTSVASVMQSWMTSEGHRANIMGNYKFFGTGYAYNAASTYGHYWTQDFGTGSSESCDGGATPVATPAPATKAPVTQAPPATKAPVAQTQAPPVYTSKPATQAPAATTAPPATKAPVYTRKPVTTRAPRTHTPRTTKPRNDKIPKTDCKPIY